MARYVVTVRTPRTAHAAFDYLADLRNFVEWDPGVKRATQIEGSGGGLGASFDVIVKSGRGEMTLRYATTHYAEPRLPQPGLLVIEARSRMLTSVDRITVTGSTAGSLVTYDAELELNGVLRCADFVLRPLFKRIGDRAAHGLTASLAGVVVSS